MSRLSFFFLTFFSLTASFLIGSGYTTPLRNDPFFIDKAPKLPGIGQEKYVLRHPGSSTDISAHKPHPGETYADYQQRMVNTLITLNHNRELLSGKIGEKEKSVTHLKELKKNLISQRVDLQLSLSDTETTAVSAASYSPAFERYTIRKGDTLQSIAFRYYGTNAAWLAIYRCNKDRLPDGPHVLALGQELFLPQCKNN